MRKSGFTLIELMIVLAIIGILSTIVIGAFQGRTFDCDVNLPAIKAYENCMADDACQMTAGDYAKMARLVQYREGCLDKSASEMNTNKDGRIR